MARFVYDARLTVHAEDEREAGRLAHEAVFLNDPVLFGCVFQPGGGIAPAELRLVEVRPESEGSGGGRR